MNTCPEFRRTPRLQGVFHKLYSTREGAFIGSPDFLPKFQAPQQFQFIDSVSLIKGSHSFKFGGEIHNTRNIFMDEPGTRGSLYFDNIFTCQIVARRVRKQHRKLLCRWTARLCPGRATDQRFRRRPENPHVRRLRPGRLEGNAKTDRESRIALGLCALRARRQEPAS